MHELHAWSGKNGQPMYTYTPDADLRETDADFFLDLEVPGVSDKSSIKIHWASPRLLIVEGDVTRPTTEDASPATASAAARNEKPDTVENGSVHAQHQQDHHEPSLYPVVDGMRLIACERKIGHYLRDFTFPVDIDRNGVKARLDAGLLQIRLPKRQSSEDKWIIEIE